MTVTMEITLTTPSSPSFESIFSREYAGLVRTLFLLTGSSWEAEDLAQEALARVLERWDRVSGMEEPVAYLHTVALNLHRRRIRRVVRRVVLHPNPEAAQTARAPDSEVEARQDVLAAIASLSPKLRQALVLAEWLELDSTELGRRLGITPSSARARLRRARLAVQKELGGTYG